jgi:hypothetical protein
MRRPRSRLWTAFLLIGLIGVPLIGVPLVLGVRRVSFRHRAAYHAARQRELVLRAHDAWRAVESLSPADREAILDGRMRVHALNMQVRHHSQMQDYYRHRW